jgi:RimJ/RimL family protein N-acetyltransferase
MDQKRKIKFSPMDEFNAREITRWRYPPPYHIYNMVEDEETITYSIDPTNNLFAMHNDHGVLVGFCSFGIDGQVPGGDYHKEALDIGLGLRPDLTGRGLGLEFINRVLKFAQELFNPTRFRVTIAAFNQRAQKVWRKAGFVQSVGFQHAKSGREFVILLREKDTLDC